MPSNTKRSAHMPANQTSHNPASKNSAPRPSTEKATGGTASSTKTQSLSEGSPAASVNHHSAVNSGAGKPPPEHPVLQSTGVNRKKQKRRNKQAARLAAERQLHDGSPPVSRAGQNGSDAQLEEGDNYGMVDEEEAYYTDDDLQDRRNPHSRAGADDNGVTSQSQDVERRKSKKKKGKKNRSSSAVPEESSTSHSTPSASATRPQGPPPLSNAALRSAHNVSKDRIWNTSTQEERENIKEFWLQLGEDERRSLVKVEKEAVLRKMKEQQKHSCSCTVCGRKRTAIEEELEVLYDAYYEELEQYANHNHAAFENGAPIGTPRRLYQPPLHSFERHPHHLHGPQHPTTRGKVQELADDEDLDDDYDEEDEEDEDEPYSEDELDDAARATRADFFAFGNSLTVKDGILTVADDLLKNDGKHFIDMMEQLAERRMQREEETQYAASSAAHQSMHAAHNHGPPLDEEDYEDEEDEEYDSQEDEEYDDEMDSMTEEQRMEEGRRMFQIFAARMFEQRVLTAYREKVARERQQKLIEELEEENRQDVEKEAKKAREAQKKKDKKRLQKQAKEEEKAKREAERAAEEAEKKALEEKRLEEQRQKKEEQRKRREAEKKAQEEERLRKEAERQKRQREERERQEEIERKQREQKEQERKKREEAKRKEREEREAKEKELQEKKAKEERERKAREERDRQQKEAAEKAERESKERAKREEQQAAQAAAVQAAKRVSHAAHPQPPPGLHHPPPTSSSLQSPHFQVATPIVPKSSTPVRPRQASQQGSHASSPPSQPAAAEAAYPSVSPGEAAASQSSGSSSVGTGKSVPQPPVLHHPQPSAPISPLGSTSRGPLPSGSVATQPPAGAGSTAPGLPQRFPSGHDVPSYPGGQYRSPESIPFPPGINPPRNAVSGRGFTPESGHTGLPFHPHPHPHPHPPGYVPQVPRDTAIPPHSRQASTSIERNAPEPQPQSATISRPAPIQRPSSTAPAEHAKEEMNGNQSDVDGLTARLGSSALLEDTDVPLSTGSSQPIPIGAAAPGAPGSGRLGFGTSPLFPDPLPSANNAGYPLGGGTSGGTWGSQMPFGPPGFASPSSWGAGPGRPNNAFGVGGPNRLHASRPVAIRLMVSQACRQLTVADQAHDGSGFYDVNNVLQRVDQLNSPNEPPVTLREMLDICDTEGNAQNGGGSFVIKSEGPRTLVKFEPDVNGAPPGASRRGGVPGDIGSPIPGGSGLAPGGIGVASTSRQFPPS